MYLIVDDRPSAPHASGLTYPHAFDRRELRDPLTQRHLGSIVPGRHRILCCCVAQGELPVGRLTVSQLHFIRGLPPVQGRHAPHCRHASGDVGDALGFKPGALARAGERLVLDLGRWLASPDEPAPSGGSGQWSGKRADHGPQLRSLLWLLLQASGMNAFHPRLPPRRLFEALYDQAGHIGVRSGERAAGSLADMVLRPDGFNEIRRKENLAKLKAIAGRRGKRVLVLSPLTRRALAATANGERRFLRLKNQLGVSVNVPEGILYKAMNACHTAQKWWETDRPVLSLSLVTADPVTIAAVGGIIGEVKHMAVMPLHECLAPTPTARHVDRLEQAVRDSQLYLVDPQEDPALPRLASGCR